MDSKTITVFRFFHDGPWLCYEGDGFPEGKADGLVSRYLPIDSGASETDAVSAAHALYPGWEITMLPRPPSGEEVG